MTPMVGVLTLTNLRCVLELWGVRGKGVHNSPRYLTAVVVGGTTNEAAMAREYGEAVGCAPSASPNPGHGGSDAWHPVLGCRRFRIPNSESKKPLTSLILMEAVRLTPRS